MVAALPMPRLSASYTLSLPGGTPQGNSPSLHLVSAAIAWSPNLVLLRSVSIWSQWLSRCRCAVLDCMHFFAGIGAVYRLDPRDHRPQRPRGLAAPRYWPCSSGVPLGIPRWHSASGGYRMYSGFPAVGCGGGGVQPGVGGSLFVFSIRAYPRAALRAR